MSRSTEVERLAEQYELLRRSGLAPGDAMRHAIESAEVEVVDLLDVEPVPLDVALRNWLMCTRAPSGAHGQSMEATMAVTSTRELRAAAARHLDGSTGAES